MSDKRLKFVCPECKGEVLECCEEGPYSSDITNIDDDGDFDYGEITADGEVNRIQCGNCGYILMNGEEPILNNEDIVKWVKENCPQAEPYIDPRYVDDNV